jgi:acyl-CoA thioesterase FadM
MHVDYLRPARIDRPVHLTGRVVAVEDRFTTVECALVSEGKARAAATVRAVRVPDSWRDPGRTT